MAAESEMRDFTRRLFQTSPDLRALTLSMVRGEYLAHVGRETLLRDEKLLLKRIVEEELLAMQLDDSSAEDASRSPESAQDTPAAGAPKRRRSGSSQDTARKKQRADQESEDGSDGEDSGIDSKKLKPAPVQGDAEKSGCTGSWEDEGDSGAEETPNRGSTSGSGSEIDSEWAAGSKARKQPQSRGQEGATRQSQPGRKRARGTQRRGDSEEQGRVTAQGEEESAGKKGARQAGRRSKQQRTEESGSEGEQAGQAEWRSRSKAEGTGEESESEASEEEEGKRQTQAVGKGPAEPEPGGARKRRPKAQSEDSGSEEQRGSRKPARQNRTKTAASGSESEEEERQPRLKAEEKGSGSEEDEERQGPPRKRGSSETDSSSASSSSARDEKSSPGRGAQGQKGKAPGREEAGPARDHPAVQRLKRYILACGVRRNYKKLLAGCSSTKQRVRVLRRELEAIGLQGNPSLERCRALRLRREEAAEVAALDVGNIIASEGRPRRRNVWSLYSSSPTPAGSPPPRRPVDWSSLRGVISSDGESD